MDFDGCEDNDDVSDDDAIEEDDENTWFSMGMSRQEKIET